MTVKINWDKNVQPHGELKQLDSRLWFVTGSLPVSRIPRNMVIYKLKNGGLLIHSAIALNAESMEKIERFGTPEYLLVPNKYHRLDAPLYRQRYENIKVICPSAIIKKVEEKVPVYDSVENAACKLGIGFYNPLRFRSGELVYELVIDGGCVLVFCDLLFNLSHLVGVTGWLLKIAGSTGFFGTTRIGRLLMKDKTAVKKLLLNLSEKDNLKYILVAHGDIISEDCNDKLRRAASF